MAETKRGIYAGTLAEVSYKDDDDEQPVPEFVKDNVGEFVLSLMRESEQAQLAR